MNQLAELIQELCPDGISFTILMNVCEISKGTQFNKADMADTGSYPVINGGINPSGYIDQYNQSENKITISQGGASAGYVNWISTKFWAGAHCYVLTPKENVDNRYLYHFVKSMEKNLQECQYGAGIPALAKTAVETLRIPLPPLPVQHEVVRILDKITELTEELTKELTARRLQYKFYIDNLFSSNHFEKRVPLFELCKIGDGLHGTPEYSDAGDYYFINGNNLNNGKIIFDKNTKKVSISEYKKYGIDLNRKTILLSINGTIGNIACYNMEKVVLGKSTAYFKILSSELHEKFLFYFLQTTRSQEYYNKNKTGGTVKNLGLKALRNYTIPLPPLTEQEHIVAILDRFDALCNDLTSGLPAEIAARQKQYEYYRDKLLAFKAAN